MQVDMLDVIDKLEAAGLIRPAKQSGDWYTLYCPFHSDGNEKKPSCGILLHDQYKNGQLYPAGMWHCFACNASYTLPVGISKILEKKNMSGEGLKWLEENIPGFKPDPDAVQSLIPDELMGQAMTRFMAEHVRARLSAKPAYITENELASYRYTVPYMYERKLTDEVIAKYDVGFDAHHVPPGRKKELPCITFPVRDQQGNTLFFCRRSIEGKYFNYPTNVTKPVYGLFELPKNATSVIICESVINCLTCVTYGYNAVALLGTGTPYQIDQLRHLGAKEFIICLDGDEAGRRGTAKLKKALSSVAFVWVMHVPEGEDVNSCTYEQFQEAYMNKE